MKKTTTIHVLIVTLILLGNSLFAQKDSIKINTIGINSPYSYKMLDQNQDLRKINILLNEKRKGSISNNKIIVSTSLITLLDYQNSNTDSKFGYLMRHPTANNQI